MLTFGPAQLVTAARIRMASIETVSLDIAVVLGRTHMPVHQVLRLGRGAIIELDAGEDDDVEILANNFPVAKGNVVVQGNRIAVEVKKLLPRSPETRGYAPEVSYKRQACKRQDPGRNPAVIAALVWFGPIC